MTSCYLITVTCFLKGGSVWQASETVTNLLICCLRVVQTTLIRSCWTPDLLTLTTVLSQTSTVCTGTKGCGKPPGSWARIPSTVHFLPTLQTFESLSRSKVNVSWPCLTTNNRIERSAQLEEGERGYRLTSLVTVLGVTSPHNINTNWDLILRWSLSGLEPTWINNNIQGWCTTRVGWSCSKRKWQHGAWSRLARGYPFTFPYLEINTIGCGIYDTLRDHYSHFRVKSATRWMTPAKVAPLQNLTKFTNVNLDSINRSQF